jgi:hypothetical protein
MTERPTKDEAHLHTARRVQWWTNVLMVLSAFAASVFFFYVLQTVFPLGRRAPEPTPAMSGTIATAERFLAGESGGLSVTLRALDDSTEYAGVLSQRIAADLAMADEGLFFRLAVKNIGEAVLQGRLDSLHGRDVYGDPFEFTWIDDASDGAGTGALGRMRLAQAARDLALESGHERQLLVFRPGRAGAMSELQAGVLVWSGGEVELTLSQTGGSVE